MGLFSQKNIPLIFSRMVTMIPRAVTAHYLAPRAMATENNSSLVDELNAKQGNKVDQPELIAKQLIQAIEKKQSEKFFAWPEKLFVKINGLLPNFVSLVIKKDQATIQSMLNSEENHEKVL